ncbi:MAG: pyridoxamine 5'-phosphate oxidase [Bdellovibrionales bacterium]|nr:pyridoxamine 5'-phosphate oxidase [Bdellovibrionales bacterium]
MRAMEDTEATEALPDSPWEMFHDWWHQAQKLPMTFPDAATLATADRTGMPSARVVLIKDFHDRGIRFYTNYESQKGRELAENPRASLVVFWDALGKQIRVSGTVARIPQAESEAYFASRPRGSQIGAWASRQSQPVGSRQELVERAGEYTRRYPDEVPMPSYWGGYELAPESFEFWILGQDRLHDRFLYGKTSQGWKRTRISP